MTMKYALMKNLKNYFNLKMLRLILLQENNEKQEERLAKYTLELAAACKR